MSNTFADISNVIDATAALPEFNPALPLDRIEELENARSDLGDMTEITASVAADGVLQPITVYRDGERYILWMGHRRLEASRRAGRTTIPAIIKPKPTPQEFLAEQVVENLISEDMSEQDIFRSCVKLEGMGMARKDIATSIGKSGGTVSRYFAPLECPDEAREYFLARKLTLGQMYAISQSPEPLETIRLFLGGATREQVAKTTRKPKADAVRTSSIKCPLPSGNVVTIKGSELSLEEAAEVLGEAAKALKDGIKRGYTAKTFNNAMKDMAAN